jgi:cobalt-zinc-cadmium efflux system outer membrane protein
VSGLILLLLTGCATVDPQPEFSRAGEFIRQSTGQGSVEPEQEEESLQQRVSEILSDGLTIEEAVELALLNNPELQAAWMDIGMAKADLIQAGLLSNPTLGVSLRFPAGGGLANLEAGLAQNIADLWQIPSRKQAASRALDRTILDLARRATLLATDAETAYYEAAGAEQLLAIRQENLDITRELLDMSLARQRAGAAGQLDINLSRSMALDAELAHQAARLARSNAMRQLAKTLGVTDVADQIILQTEIGDPPAAPPSAEELIGTALVSRLDVQAARQTVEAAAARLELEYARVFPNVEFGVALERDARKAQGGRDILADTARASIANGQLTAPEIQPRSERDQDTDFIIGPSLSMELPVFDQNQAQIAKARYAYQQAVRTLDALERMVVQDTRTAVDQVLTAWAIATTYRERSVPLAQSNLELSKQAYQAGQASFLSVLEAQRFFLDSRAQYIEALRAAAIAIPDLERTIGLPYESLISRSTTRPASTDVITTQPGGES